jgi:lipoate-protein ligase A
MATDEALLLYAAEKGGVPTLRFFTWSPPALSLGYAQNAFLEIDIAQCQRSGIDIVRRPTGGRAVLHDQEVTYSLIVAQPTSFFPDDLLGSYKVISQAIIRGLSFLNVHAVLEPPRRTISSHPHLAVSCFLTLSSYEIAVDGRKLVGSAQRRFRGALLQQGSLLLQLDIPKFFALLQLSSEVERQEGIKLAQKRMTSLAEVTGKLYAPSTVQAALLEGFRAELGIEFIAGKLTLAEESFRQRLLKEKYQTPEWNLYRRG